MRSILKISYNNIKNILLIKGMLLILFIIIILKKDSVIEYLNLSNYIEYILCGTKNLSDNVSELLLWSLYHFYILGISSKYIYSEFRNRNILHISRIGSKFKWYLSVELTLIFLVFTYHLIAICTIGISYFFLNPNASVGNLISILYILFLLMLSSLLYINIYIIFLLISKKNNVSIIYIILLIYISICIGSSLNIDIYIPLNMVIFAKYITTINSLIYSDIYLLLINFIIFIILYKKILMTDITKITN